MEPVSGQSLNLANDWLRKRRLYVVAAIVFCSVGFRAIYYAQLSAGPCLWQHRWEESDMHFFDEWGARIAGGDWLTDTAFHPLLSWHREISQAAISSHPELAQSLGVESERTGEKDLDFLLWNRWLGGKCFHQEPLYPYLVGLTYRIFGHDVRYVFAWQMMMGIGSVMLIYGIAWQYAGEIAGAIAGVIAMLYAPLMYHELLLLRDTVMVFFALAVVFLFNRAIDKKTGLDWFWSGVVLGLALLLKSTFAPFVLLGVFMVCARYWGERDRVYLCTGSLILGVLLALSPAISRNLYEGVPPLALSSPGMGALALAVNNSEDYPADSGWVYNTKYAPQIMADSNGRFFAAGFETLKTHPNLFSVLKMIWHKFSFVWHWYEIPCNDNFYYYRLHASVLAWLPLSFLIVAPFAVPGILVLIPKMNKMWPLYLMLFTTLVPLLISSIQARYRIPFAALLLPFAAMTFGIIIGSREKKLSSLLATGAVVVLMFIWVGRPLSVNEHTIRYVDFAAPYSYYYRPEIGIAMNQKNWPKMEAILLDALSVEPFEITKCGPGHPPQTQYELDLALPFGWTHYAYSICLQSMGRTREAEAQAERSKELSASSRK